MSVHGWVSAGGAELGTSRKVPSAEELGALAGVLTAHQVEGILLVGGWAAYQAAFRMQAARGAYAAFRIPIVCVPAGIDNSLPGLGALHRRRHRAERDRLGGRQDQAVGRGLAARVRRRGDGALLRLPRRHVGPRDGGRAGLHARGGDHDGGASRRTSRASSRASGRGSASR